MANLNIINIGIYITLCLTNIVMVFGYTHTHKHTHISRNITETYLFDTLFGSYDKLSIPIKNESNNVELLYGHEINGLVYFNQKDEKIKFNMISTIIWKDEYLKWTDIPQFRHIDWIFVPSYKVWQPDLELYNSGSKPELFELHGKVKLFRNGFILYNRPTSFSFSCKLQLSLFPFDTQQCSMLFGSWKYPKKTLNLRPFTSDILDEIDPLNFTAFRNTLSKINNISVDQRFSHNEWNIDNIDVKHSDLKYKCCPDDLWPNTEFSIVLTRNSQKYIIVIIMACLITLSSLTISMIKINEYYRTYVLVFIPLTLIWLQIHTSSKIPVIEYPTKLEYIIQLCFYISITSAIESGILYNILLNQSNYIEQKIGTPLFKYKKIDPVHNSLSIVKDHSININTNLYLKSFKNNIFTLDSYFRRVLILVFLCVLVYLLIDI